MNLQFHCIFQSQFNFKLGLKENPGQLTASLCQYKFLSRSDTELGSYLFRCGDRHPVRGEQKREIISHIHLTLGSLGTGNSNLIIGEDVACHAVIICKRTES